MPANTETNDRFEKLAEHCQVLEEDLRLAESEIRKQRRQIATLKAQRARELADSPEGRKANIVAKYYEAVFKPGKNWRFGEKRQKAVLARINEGREVSYICRAIDGFKIGHGSNLETGVKYDDLELCCRDETTIERWYRTAEANDAPTLMGPAWQREIDGQLERIELGV